MGSPSVQNQKVVEAWTTPLFVDNEHALNHLRIIYCNIYTTRKKRFRLGTYNTDQITIDTTELIGLTMRKASQLIRTRKEQYNQMLNLLEGES